MNIKYILLAFLLIIVLACSKKTALNSVYIQQIESDYPIIVNGNVADNRVLSIEIPLLFEYTDSTNLKEITMSYYYYNQLVKLYDYDNSRAWSSRIRFYQIIDTQIKEKILGGNQSIKVSKDAYSTLILGYPAITLDTTKATQELLAPYLEQLKKRGVQGKDTLSVGSYQEFKAKYPELVKTLLEGDSIAFKVANDQNKLDTVILLPIRY